jgi:hypothetical protein
MDHIRKEIRRALLVCVPYFLIIFFLDDLDKFLFSIHSRLGNPLLVVYMFLATVIIFALLIHSFADLKENYKASGYKAMVPMMIYLISMLNSFWSPLRISSEIFHSKIVYSAFRREKYGHAKMKLRKNGSMDICYPAQFWMSDWEYGKWNKRGDTFFLNYDKGRDTAYVKPDTLILSDGLLTPIGIPSDTLKIYKDLFFRMPIVRKK